MNKYVVGKCGHVFGPRGRLKRHHDKDGYPVVFLWVGGRTIKRRPHRLVAERYLTNSAGHPEVNHKDEDKTNSWDWNLEWMSVKDNRNHGTRNERIKKSLTAKSR